MKSIGGCWNGDVERPVPLKKIIMPPNIEFIPIGAASAEEVIFPENSSVKVIGHRAFENVSTITIPSSVVSIGYQAFENYILCIEKNVDRVLKNINEAFVKILLNGYKNNYPFHHSM